MRTKLSFRIRAVDGVDEEETLRELHEACFAATAPHPDYAVGDWWLAYAAEVPVGFAGMVASDDRDDTGYMNRSGVLTAFRGNGLQRRLIRVREHRARKYGWQRLITDTTCNVASSNSLISAGYKLYAPSTPWAFSYSLYWRKYL